MIWAHFCLFSPILFAVLTTFNLQCPSLVEKSHHKLCGVSGSFTAFRVQAFSCPSLGKGGKKNLLLKTYWVKKTRDEINIPFGPWDVRTSGRSMRLQGRWEAELLQRHELAGLMAESSQTLWGGWCSGSPQKPGCSPASLPHFPVTRLQKIKASPSSRTLDWSCRTQPAIVSGVNSHHHHGGQNGS